MPDIDMKDAADELAAQIIARLIDADLQTLRFAHKRDIVAAYVRRAWTQGFRAGTLQREHQADYDDARAEDDWMIP